MKIREDLTGKTFHRLKVIKRVQDGKTNTRWLCLCECGKETIAVTGNLKRGKHKSCGCWREGPTSRNAMTKTTSNGYVFVKAIDHPRANKNSGRVREHIIVMEEKLGRHLLPNEEVHHLNGQRADNEPENLELWTKSQPSGARVEDKTAWAIKILKTYKPELLK